MRRSQRNLSFFWIDDSNSRKSLCAQIVEFKTHKGVKSKAAFIHVSGENPAILFTDKVKKSGTPDLVIMDHFLNRKVLKQDGVPTKGSTVAEFIRESYQIPIVAITGAAKMGDVETYKEAYDDVCDVTNFRNYIASLYTIAVGFQCLKGKKISSKEDLILLLNPAKDDVNKLLALLPNDLIGKDGVIIPRAFRWLWHVFFKRPGLLYDRDWTATFLGLKPESFIKVEHFFTKAKYDGIFANPDNPLWWPAKASEILFKLTSKHVTCSPWERGHFLKGITVRDYSRCTSCRELFPEIMGFPDESRLRRIPLHLKCSETCTTSNKALFFEEDRKIQDE
jgi:CheY-like chemotaxis protein